MRPSTIFFPLRTNVNYFQSRHEYMDLQSRVKQSLILYDRVVFQAGKYRCFVGPGGIIQNYQSLNNKGSEQKDLHLEEDDKEAKNFWLKVRPTGAGPTEPFTTIIDSPLDRSFRSQFHTLVAEIRNHGIDDVELRNCELPAELIREMEKVAEADIQDIEFEIENDFLKNRIIKNLNSDLLLMSLLNWPAFIDSLHAPLVLQKAKNDSRISNLPGYLSLNTWVPYVGTQSWEELAEFRNHPALNELRNKLVDAENQARAMFEEASEEDISYEISQILSNELLKEVRRLRPSGSEIARDVGVDVALNLVGAILPVLSPLTNIASLAKNIPEIMEIYNQRNSWITAFMDLRNRKQ